MHPQKTATSHNFVVAIDELLRTTAFSRRRGTGDLLSLPGNFEKPRVLSTFREEDDEEAIGSRRFPSQSM